MPRQYLVYFVLFAHAANATAYSAAKPNVVLMVLDDFGHADLSMNGGSFPTPNLDALARTGANLKRMYVQPVCSPTRSALMTGRFPFHTGLQHFTTLLPGGTAKLPLAPHKTLAEMFKGQGYSTSMIGKWVSFNYVARKLTHLCALFQRTHSPSFLALPTTDNEAPGLRQVELHTHRSWV